MLYVQAKITQPNGIDLRLLPGRLQAPVNLFLHSLFSQVDIQLNGSVITSSTNTYPYLAILETLLSYGEDAKKTQLKSALYYKDAAGQMDTLALTAGDGVIPNEGLVKRLTHQSESRRRYDGGFACRHFLPGSLHVERSQRQYLDKVGA